MKKANDIKRAQKASLYLRVLSTLFTQIMCDDRSLLGISLSRVELSPDKSVCVIYFYTPGGLEEFEQKLEQLKLYKPSIRAALSKQINGRYTPELVFKFDTVYEKSMRVEHLLDELKKKEEL